MNDAEYKGYYITKGAYGKDEFTVQYDGDDVWFDTEDDAKEFIDSITEDHFDDKEDEIEPEEPDYDEDDVLNETDHIGEGYYRVWYTDFDTGEDRVQDIWGYDNAYVRRMINPQGRVKKIRLLREQEEPNAEDADGEFNLPYTTKDLALGVVDLLNSAAMDWDTGDYPQLYDAFDNLNEVPVFETFTEDEWDDILSDGNYAKLQHFIESHPNEAEEIFTAIGKAFGFANYQDYRTYVDWIESDDYVDEAEYYSDDYVDYGLDDRSDWEIENQDAIDAMNYRKVMRDIYGDDEDDLDTLNEVTNASAIPSVPGKHVVLDLEEDDEEKEDDDKNCEGGVC